MRSRLVSLRDLCHTSAEIQLVVSPGHQRKLWCGQYQVFPYAKSRFSMKGWSQVLQNWSLSHQFGSYLRSRIEGMQWLMWHFEMKLNQIAAN